MDIPRADDQMIGEQETLALNFLLGLEVGESYSLGFGLVSRELDERSWKQRMGGN